MICARQHQIQAHAPVKRAELLGADVQTEIRHGLRVQRRGIKGTARMAS